MNDSAVCDPGKSMPLRHSAKRLLQVLVLLLLTVPLLGNPSTAAAQAGQKVVEGKVLDANDHPQQGAIVYLKNGKTGDIKSFISVADGGYRFGQLSPDIDYDLWAEYQGHKSSTKTVSSFDSKKLLSYNLKVDAGGK
jgi:hypothetical protein